MALFKNRLSKIAGSKASYLALVKKWKAMPFAVHVPVFGNLSTVAEIKNLHDNFGAGELRDDLIEKTIKEAPCPVVVDCGVNVGITVRWWFGLNPLCRVIGVEMMQEAHDFTARKLNDLNPELTKAYKTETGVLGKADGQTVAITFDDPLFGENEPSFQSGKSKRSLPTLTLDGIIQRQNVRSIALLKLDIEGGGGTH